MSKKVMSVELRRDELNIKFGGGFPTNSLVLVEGPVGSGKSILVQRITYGLLKHGYNVTYVSTELNTMGFVEQMNSLKYDINDELMNDDLLFVPMFPFFGNATLDDNFMERMLTSDKLFEKDVVIFDTLSYLIVKDSITNNRTFDVIMLLKKIIAMQKTVIFCVDPKHFNDKFLDLVKTVSDIYFELEIKMILGSLLRIVNVKRFKRSIEEVTPSIPFKVLPRIGLAIELASLS